MTLGGMSALVSQRLNEGAQMGGPTFYPAAEITAALNEADRLFCLLTLCLEVKASWNVAAATTFFHMLAIFSDWIAPLRITSAAGAKIRPSTIGELRSLDSQWPLAPGAPIRYVLAGGDLLALYKQPAASGTTLTVQYAGAPTALALSTDTPGSPPEYHPHYVSYAIYRLRQVEGGSAFAAALPLLAEFLDAATELAEFVKARNVGQGYDSVPMELKSYDRSRLVAVAKKKV